MTSQATSRISGTQAHGVSTLSAVAALVRLRWSMVRRPSTRVAALSALAISALALVGGAAVAANAPRDYDVTFGSTLAVLLVAFPLLAFLAGMGAGGGVELVPSAQLVAFPLSPTAMFVTSVLLAPLNLALALQGLVVVWMAAYAAGPGLGALAGVLLAFTFLLAATVAGLALSWLVTGIRATRRGRRATEGLVLAAATGIVVAALLRGWTPQRASDWAADRFTDIVVGLMLPSPGAPVVWGGVLVATLVVSGALGLRATDWTTNRRSEDADGRESAKHRRRAPARSEFGQLVRTDLASVWRSRPIRRGLVLLCFFPGLALAASSQPWETLLFVPALIATGTTLAFGVNAFALDGSGALWLESLPRSPTSAFWSKVTVSAGTTAAVTLGALLLAGLRPRPVDSWATLAALALLVVVATLWATAVSMRQSLRRPFPADMRAPRDAPAPPAVMTLHSVRLMGTQLLATSVLIVAWRLGTAGLALVAGILALAAVARLAALARRWRQDSVRLPVVHAVSTG